MPEILIRPVTAEIDPVLTATTITSGGKVYTFPIPPEFRVDIHLHELFLETNMAVRIKETGQEEIDLGINTFPHLANQDFLMAFTFLRTRGSLEGRSREAIILLPEDTFFRKYVAENPSELCLVEGINYQYLIGKKEQSVFVDGWLRKPQTPSWRVTIPLRANPVGDLVFKEISAPNSKLLIFS